MAVVQPAISRIAKADNYPSRPVRIVVGFPPGGGGDITARLISQWLSEHLGQSFIVDNRPGAGSNIAAEAVVRASADGYTLLLVTSTNTINASFYDKLDFDLIRDIAPVASLTRGPLVMEVNPIVPVKTVAEFIAYAKANPGKLTMASAGNGTGPHVAGELFEIMTGVDMVHVPYHGSAPAVTDLLAGRVQVMFDIMSSSVVHIKTGKLRALAVTSATRSDILPELPTVGDFLPGHEASNIRVIGAPKNTPREIIEKLNTAISAALADPKIKARLTDLGDAVLALSSAEAAKLIADDTEKWAKVIKSAGIKPE